MTKSTNTIRRRQEIAEIIISMTFRDLETLAEELDQYRRGYDEKTGDFREKSSFELEPDDLLTWADYIVDNQS